MDDEYLWSKRGTPDAEVERFEKLLARYRFDDQARPWIVPADAGTKARLASASREADGVVLPPIAPSDRPRPEAIVPGASRGAARPARHSAPRPRWVLLALAAAVLVALALGLWNRDSRSVGPESSPAQRGYRLVGIPGRDRVRAGEEVVTGDGGGATLEIGGLGSVELRPRTSLRIEASEPEEHRFYLDRGAVHAKIFASPRRFQIGTPAGRSIDLGCEYTLVVGDDGLSRLTVLNGQVAFEFDGREVYVPAGATCISMFGRGPSAPVFDDAPPEFKRALAAVESGSPPPAEALARLLACDQEEALSVWHLFDSDTTPAEIRRALYGRLSRIFAKPQGVTEAGLLAGDRAMREAWLETMKPWWKRQG
jgi:hypothetical protein